MENASKALLIAAAVLIAIVIIAVGIKILDSTSGVTDQVDSVSKSMEVLMFNSMFENYTGNNKSKTEVESLLNRVIINNKSNKIHQIQIIVGSISNQGYGQQTYEGPNITNLLKNVFSYSEKYIITIDEYDEEGYITKIFIDV